MNQRIPLIGSLPLCFLLLAGFVSCPPSSFGQYGSTQPPYVQDALRRVQVMIQRGQLESAEPLNTYVEDVTPQQAPAGGYPSHVYVATPGGGLSHATSQNMPSVDKKAYVVFRFTYYSQGGFLNRRDGWLVYTRDSRSGNWSFSPNLSTIDGLPKRSYY